LYAFRCKLNRPATERTKERKQQKIKDKKKTTVSYYCKAAAAQKQRLKPPPPASPQRLRARQRHFSRASGERRHFPGRGGSLQGMLGAGGERQSPLLGPQGGFALPSGSQVLSACRPPPGRHADRNTSFFLILLFFIFLDLFFNHQIQKGLVFPGAKDA